MFKIGREQMSILPQLEENKGLVSSALGKSLARQVLAGQTPILEEAVELLAHEDKNVRAGAAKIVEQVAMVDPGLVVDFCPQILPALAVPERQTRWMVIHALGYCASLDTTTALRALPRAQAFIEADSGACLWGATIVYLGHVGATSRANAQKVFPLLEQALHDVPKQAKKVLESFLGLLDQADDETRAKIAGYAETCAQSDKATLKRVARKIQKELEQRQ